MAGPSAGGSNKRRPKRQGDDGRPFGVRGNQKNSHGLIARLPRLRSLSPSSSRVSTQSGGSRKVDGPQSAFRNQIGQAFAVQVRRSSEPPAETGSRGLIGNGTA